MYFFRVARFLKTAGVAQSPARGRTGRPLNFYHLYLCVSIGQWPGSIVTVTICQERTGVYASARKSSVKLIPIEIQSHKCFRVIIFPLI